MEQMTSPLVQTALHQEHTAAGAKMVPYAGFEMPVSYAGLVVEHHAVRKSCGMFDVSHMGQVRVRGKDAASFLEFMTVVDTRNLARNNGSLSLLMTEKGTIKDDCIITKLAEDDFYVVLNAGCKETDLKHMAEY